MVNASMGTVLLVFFPDLPIKEPREPSLWYLIMHLSDRYIFINADFK